MKITHVVLCKWVIVFAVLGNALCVHQHRAEGSLLSSSESDEDASSSSDSDDAIIAPSCSSKGGNDDKNLETDNGEIIGLAKAYIKLVSTSRILYSQTKFFLTNVVNACQCSVW